MVAEVGHSVGVWCDELDNIHARLARCEERWSLRIGGRFAEASDHYVAPVIRSDGTAAVIKLGRPGLELRCEIEALRIFEGRGSVRLLDADPEEGCLLLEQLKPGTPLSSLENDGQAITAAVKVMQQLWRPVPAAHSFPSIAEWAAGLGKLRQRFSGGTGPLPVRLVEEAETLFTELIATMAEPVLLHGDLHPGNILAAERQPWLAVDPKGVAGEPACELWPLLVNPRRVDQLADELDLDRQRIRAWGIAQGVLAAWWCIEDHGAGWEWAINRAEALFSRLPRPAM